MTEIVVQPLKTNRVSLAVRTQHYLAGLIDDGIYLSGDQLPSEADLAAQLGISRPTLREALLNLEQEGRVVRKHGVGTFVARVSRHRLGSGLERLESILESAAREGFELKFRSLRVSQEPVSSQAAEKLGVNPDTEVTHVQRVIVVEGTPVAYMADAVLSSLLSAQDVDDSFNGSVLDLLRQKKGLLGAQVIADIEARKADASLSDRLEIEPGQAVQLLEETLFDAEGKAVGFSRNYFVPGFFRFHVLRR
jgi:GntR family transcriptional regulator